MSLNGTVGKGIPTPGIPLMLYKVPDNVQYSTAVILCVNSGSDTAIISMSVTKESAPSLVDRIAINQEVPPDGGYFEYNCRPIGPGEQVFIETLQPNVVCSVSALTKE